MQDSVSVTRAAPARLPNAVNTPSTVPIAPSRTVWGYFPMLCLSSSLSLMLVALSNTAARNELAYASPLLWLGLLVIFVPIALRLVSSQASSKERAALVILLGCSLYMVKVLHSPLDFTFHDEFLHWNTANHILETHHLFSENSILPVSPRYPGLEIIATAFAEISRLSLVESGIIVLGIARVVFMLGLYLFFTHIGSSPRIGGIAALLYTANSNFLYFDSQFSYESLSLPLALTILYIAASRDDGYERPYIGQIALALPLILTVTLTHHLTAYVMTGFLMLWALMALLRRRTGTSRFTLLALALIALVASLTWTLSAGNSTSEYLTPVFRSGIRELTSILFNENTGRQLFQSATGVASPLWERIVGIAAVIAILLVLPIGVLQIILSPFRRFSFKRRINVLPAASLSAWQRYRHNPAALALAFVVLLHPVMQGFRLTASGWEIANRSSEFLFLAIAFILAVAVVSIMGFRLPKLFWYTAFAIWSSVIFVGGAISGWPPWARQPSTYLVSADSRSVEAEGISAATWTREYLPAYSRFSADRVNTLLLSAYGGQRAITHLADNLYLASVFFSPTLGADELGLLRAAQVEYLLVDMRLSTALPMVGVYFEAGEPQIDTALSAAALEKFDDVPAISRVFDSGSIRVYELGTLYDLP